MALRVSLPLCIALCGAAGAPPLLAQRAVTRAQAAEAALARGARAAFGRADVAAAAGALHGARLSRRNALAADSLRKMAQLRREVGDVSELDVHLAAVNAGQIENAAADDSVAAVEALLSVQLAMGLPGDDVSITLADSLAPPPPPASPDSGPAARALSLPVAAAAANLRSA